MDVGPAGCSSVGVDKTKLTSFDWLDCVCVLEGEVINPLNSADCCSLKHGLLLVRLFVSFGCSVTSSTYTIIPETGCTVQMNRNIQTATVALPVSEKSSLIMVSCTGRNKGMMCSCFAQEDCSWIWEDYCTDDRWVPLWINEAWCQQQVQASGCSYFGCTLPALSTSSSVNCSEFYFHAGN